MAEYIMARLLPFAQTLAEWTATNPTPKQGEIVIEVGSPMKSKLGNGSSPYLSLPYITGGAGTPQTLQDTLNLGNVVDHQGLNVGIARFTNNSADPLHKFESIIEDDGIAVFYLTNKIVDIGHDPGAPATIGQPYVRILGSISGIPVVFDTRMEMGYISVKDITNNKEAKLSCGGQIPALSLGCLLTNKNVAVYPVDTLAANRIQRLQDKNGTIALLSDILAGGSLQAALNAGNTADNAPGNTDNFLLTDLGTGCQATVDPNVIRVNGVTGYAELIEAALQVWGIAAHPLVKCMADDTYPSNVGGMVAILDAIGGPGSVFYGKIKVNPSGLSASTDYFLPIEAASVVPLDFTFVTHKTKDPITLDDGAGNIVYLNPAGIQLINGANTASFIPTLFQLENASFKHIITLAQFEYKDISTGFSIYLAYPAGVSGSSKTISIPNENGTLAMRPIYALATDAAYVVPSGNMFVELPVITANRAITMSSTSAGDTLEFANLNTAAFVWTLAGVAVLDCGGATITTLVNNTSYRFRFNGTNWRMM